MRRLVIIVLRWYQRTLSPDTGFLKRWGVIRGQVCVFHPTCSEYTIQAVEKYGIFRGLLKGVRRILRCHPWQKKHIDPLT